MKSARVEHMQYAMTKMPVALVPGDPPPPAWYDGSDQGGTGGESPADTILRITAATYGVDVSRVTANDTVVLAKGIGSSQPNFNSYNKG